MVNKLLTIALFAPALFGAAVNTERNDVARSSVYVDSVITKSNVNRLKKKATYTTTADVFAQPLVYDKPGCTISPCHILITASADNHISGWDADASGTPSKLWDRFTGTAVSGSLCNGDFASGNVCGLTATPVIDPAIGVVFVESQLATNVHLLSSINIMDGTQYHADVTLAATDPFSGVTFASAQGFEIARAGLALINGHIYITYASRGDAFTGTLFVSGYTWFGWILRFSESTFTVDAATCNTCAASISGGTGGGGGMWMGGAAPVSDGTYLYVTAGNGTYASASSEYGTSVVKYDLSLNLIDWWTPYNYAALTGSDLDLTSPPILMPSKWLIFGGKDSIVRVADRTNMGHLEPNTSSPTFSGTNLHQEFDLGHLTVSVGHIIQGILISPANDLYISGTGAPILRFAWDSGTTLVQDTGAFTTKSPANLGSSGAQMLYSWDGSHANTGVLFGVSNTAGGYNPTAGLVIAYDPVTLAQLWTSGNVTGDTIGNSPKLSSPALANGTLYVPTRSQQVISFSQDTLNGMVQ